MQLLLGLLPNLTKGKTTRDLLTSGPQRRDIGGSSQGHMYMTAEDLFLKF